jgi:RND family efflux transporter MFP subunit
MYKRLRNLTYLGCIAILAAAFVRVTLRSNVSASSTVAIQETSTVDQGDIILTVSATGPIHALAEIPLAFPSMGNVVKINVTEGDHVLKGQTLASLDTQAMQTALRNAQLTLNLQQIAYNALAESPRDADLKAAKAAVDAAKAQLGAASIGSDPLQVRIAELQLEVAKNAAWQSQLQRDQAVDLANKGQPDILTQIYAQVWRLPPDRRDQVLEILAELTSPSSLGGYVPSPKDAEAQVHYNDYGAQIAQAQLDQTKAHHADLASVAAAQLAVTTTQATLDALTEGADEQTLAVAQAQIKAAQTAVDLANYNVSRAVLLAPADGVVAQINLTPGEPAPTDKPAVLLLDDSGFYVDVPVDEVDISKVQVGQNAALTLDSLPNEAISGKVTRLAPIAQTIGGVVTYLVRVTIESAGHPLRVGMSATSTITVAQLNNVIRVRNRFVRLDRKTGKASVMVRKPDGSVSEVPVTLGLRNETYSEVKSGLSVGDVVVVLPREFNLLG